jgi:hypothetical protein
MKKSPQEKSSTKTFSLTADETANIDSRQSLIKQYQYLIHVINADIQAYIEYGPVVRLGIQGKNRVLSADNTTLKLVGGEDEI